MRKSSLFKVEGALYLPRQMEKFNRNSYGFNFHLYTAAAREH